MKRAGGGGLVVYVYVGFFTCLRLVYVVVVCFGSLIVYRL